MKNRKFFIVALLALLVAPIFVMAQDPTPPESPIEWVGRLPEMIGSFWGCVVSALMWVPILIGLLKLDESKKLYKYILTVVVVAILTAAATILDFGYLYGAKMWFVLVNGVYILGAQIFGYAALKPFLDAVAKKFDPWKPTEPPA